MINGVEMKPLGNGDVSFHYESNRGFIKLIVMGLKISMVIVANSYKL